MAEYVDKDKPIIIKNETDSDLNVGAGIVFRKSGIYEITITDSTITVTKISERKTVRCDSSNILRYPECENRTKLGNCNPVGGFCTSVPKDICDAQNHRQNAVDIIHIDAAKIVRDKLWEKAIKREKEEAQQAAGDTISRQAVLELTMQYCPDDDGTCSKAGSDIRELLDDIEHLPPAQPERETAKFIRWMEIKKTANYISYTPHCKCSKCGTEFLIETIKYCYMCGAKMMEDESSCPCEAIWKAEHEGGEQ